MDREKGDRVVNVALWNSEFGADGHMEHVVHPAEFIALQF